MHFHTRAAHSKNADRHNQRVAWILENGKRLQIYYSLRGWRGCLLSKLLIHADLFVAIDVSRGLDEKEQEG